MMTNSSLANPHELHQDSLRLFAVQAMSLESRSYLRNGVLKAVRELPLHEGQKVILTIQPVGSAASRFCGSLRWTRDVEELHRYLNDPDESSWASHDI